MLTPPRSRIFPADKSAALRAGASVILAAGFLYSTHGAPLQSFTSYDDVHAVLSALNDDLPPDLKALDESARRAAWKDWVDRHDHEIRERLARGDDDSIVNWLLFGTTFTKQPRALLDVAAVSAELPDVIAARTRDLISALRSANADEHRVFARDLLRKKGYRLDSGSERTRLEQYLRSEVERVVSEQQEYARRLNAAVLASNVAEEVAARSRLYHDRGVSLDTTLLPAFAIEEALRTVRNQKLISAGDIQRVAIIGPGLDFADKNFGYDFYPPQTLQPFTTIDSLVRLGLSAKPADVEVTTLDISARVNDHVLRLRDRARAGDTYALRLPLDFGSSWVSAFTAYWKTMGDQIGREIRLERPPQIGKQLNVRGVGVRPEVAARVTPIDFNVVTQRWTGPPFDLVIATNVFVYYERLDQSLAFLNVDAMLRPGGFFLTNNPIVELPNARLRSLGALQVQYSLEPVRSDYVFWYRRTP